MTSVKENRRKGVDDEIQEPKIAVQPEQRWFVRARWAGLGLL